MRRELEKRPEIFSAEEIECSFLVLLKNNLVLQRQQFLQFALNACLPAEWFQSIKDAYVTADADQDLANQFVLDHQAHMNRLKSALLTSTEFRKDFIEKFPEYLKKLERDIDAYNARYKKDKHQHLKINFEKARDQLVNLYFDAHQTCETSLLRDGLSPSEARLRILQSLAFLNLDSACQKLAEKDSEIRRVDQAISAFQATLPVLLDRAAMPENGRKFNFQELLDQTRFFKDLEVKISALDALKEELKEELKERVGELEKNLETAITSYDDTGQYSKLLESLESTSITELKPVKLEKYFAILAQFLNRSIVHRITLEFSLIPFSSFSPENFKKYLKIKSEIMSLFFSWQDQYFSVLKKTPGPSLKVRFSGKILKFCDSQPEIFRGFYSG